MRTKDEISYESSSVLSKASKECKEILAVEFLKLEVLIDIRDVLIETRQALQGIYDYQVNGE